MPMSFNSMKTLAFACNEIKYGPPPKKKTHQKANKKQTIKQNKTKQNKNGKRRVKPQTQCQVKGNR